MTISANVSLLAQSMSQSDRLIQMRATMDDLQRQATTQKKYDNFSGFGTASFNLQRLRQDQPLIQSYLSNIDTVSTRMDLMSSTMSKISSVGTQLIHAIQVGVQGSQIDIAAINQLAQQNMQFVEDLLNQNIDGHYVFAGSDVANKPFIDDGTLNANFQNQVTNWLNGSASNAQLINNTDGFSATNLGLSPGLSTSGDVTAQIGHNMDVNYTVKADAAGFQDILRALTLAANLKIPNGTTDVATQAQFSDLLTHVITTASAGVAGVDASNQSLASKYNLAKSVKDSHTSDLNLITTQIDTLENADPTSAMVSLQSLQTQLTAAYQITRVVSQLSLVNFM